MTTTPTPTDRAARLAEIRQRRNHPADGYSYDEACADVDEALDLIDEMAQENGDNIEKLGRVIGEMEANARLGAALWPHLPTINVALRVLGSWYQTMALDEAEKARAIAAAEALAPLIEAARSGKSRPTTW